MSCRPHVRRPLKVRFWEKVQTSDDCWIWTGCKSKLGYGYLYVGNGKWSSAHRVAYQLLIGPIPEGKELDHFECSNPSCVNPAHLKPVTHKENMLRGMGLVAKESRQTHCKHGHEFTPENTRWRTNRYGRDCRTCTKQRNDARYRLTMPKR